MTLDPANHRRRDTETIIRNMYDGLLTRNPRMEVRPELAKSWKQIDRLTYEFTLHKGIKFHNGEEMTADDVKFTFDRLSQKGAMAGRTSPRLSLLPSMRPTEMVDRYTVRIHLNKPWPHLPAMLPLQQIVSKRFTEGKSLSELKITANGTGPFRLVAWKPGNSITMARFDGYYGGAKTIPPVDKACANRLVFKIIPSNEARVAALLAGEVDIINQLPVEAVAQVRSSATVRVMKAVGTRTFFVSLNNKKPPFDNLKVRMAANHALNKQRIIQDMLSGNAFAVNGVLGPDAFSFNPDLPAFEYDQKKARRLLAEAGYSDGIDVKLDVTKPFVPLAENIARALDEVGIHATIRPASTYADIKSKWNSTAGKTGDMWLTSWGNSSLDPVGIFVPTLHTGGRGNFSAYSNPEVDRLLDTAEVELNRSERARLYRAAQAIVNAEAPWIFLWVPEDLYGVSRRLSGWRPSPDSRINLHDACVK